MTQIMIAHEKDGPRYIDMGPGLWPVTYALLQERVDAGTWYDDAATHKAALALAGADKRVTPWHFLYSRRNHEYERVEIVDLEVITS